MLAVRLVEWVVDAGWRTMNSADTLEKTGATWLLTAALIFLLVLFAARFALGERLHRGCLPPGPLGVPLLGYLPFLRGEHVHLLLGKLARIYGPVFRLYLGGQLVVVITDHKIIRDAFRLEVFSGRPRTAFSQILGGYGIINSDGELWKEQRRFVHERLRNFGARSGQNRDDLERRIMGEARVFLKVLGQTEGKAYDLHHLLASSLSNVICSMLMGARFHHRDPRFLRFLYLMDEGLRLFTLTAPVNLLPGLRYVPGINRAYKKLTQNRDEMFAFFRDMVDQHKADLDPDNVRDFLDAYLVEMDRKQKAGDSDSYFSEQQLHQIIGDLFSAGLEPVKDTLQWAVLYMMTHPEVQSKVQEELDSVVGDDRLPSLQDLPYLPYTEATIMEVQRMANVLAIGTTRAAKATTTLCGYVIPKNAHILPLLFDVHMDPVKWGNPQVFDPSRFLDKSGRVSKPDYFMPFSTGRRMCIGDVLAKMEIFVFLSSLLHQFTVSVPEGEPTPSLEGVTVVTRTPSHFKVAATRRRDTICTTDIFGDS